MRARLTTIVAATAIMLVPLFASADTVEDQLRLMNDRMTSMEDQLQATQDQLEDANTRVERQQEILEKAGLERQAQSGLSAFLSETEFSGHMAASYNYNHNNNDSSSSIVNGGRLSGGQLGFTAPFHSQPNNFQLDQFYLAMQKPATAESRGGWMFGIVWGESADIANGAGDEDVEDQLPLSPYVHRAYVEYLADIGSGVNIRLGRWGTPVGAESFLTTENYQITRGLLWSLQPVNHTGLEISGDCDCGIDWSLAVANDFSDTNLDSDQGKTFVGHVGYTAETWGASLNGVYGGNLDNTIYGLYDVGGFSVRGAGSSKDKVGLLDFVFTADPSDDFSMWFNFDYYWSKNSGNTIGASSLTVYGFAAAGRYAITDSTGISLRGEYLIGNDAGVEFAFDELDFGVGSSSDIDLWAITGTLDHALTDNLTVRVENRVDWGSAQGTTDRFFVKSSTSGGNDRIWGKSTQVLSLVQLLYRF